VRVWGRVSEEASPSPQPDPLSWGPWETVSLPDSSDRDGSVIEGKEASGHRVLIGGVGYRWQGDASFGLVASDELARREWPPGIEVADLGYGAIYVAQDLLDARPPYDRVILLAGMERGREPGRIYRCQWRDALPAEAEIQARVQEAGAGVVDVDNLLVIAQYFRALPDDVVLVELEPVDLAAGDALSAAVSSLMPAALDFVRREALAVPRQAKGSR
jgi:hydrogenase maturation protease